MKAGKLSASKISTFRACHLRFWFQYMGGFKSTDVGGYEVGSLTHKALELWHLKKQTTLETLNERVWDAAALIDEEDEKTIRTTLEILEKWYENYDTNEEILGIEQKFDLELAPGVQVRGSIDKIIRYDEHTIAVVDYKTTWRAATRDEMDNNIQLGIYNLAARDLYPDVTNVVLILDFIRHTPQEVQYSEEDLGFLREWLVHIHATIKSIDDPKPNPNSDSCRWCGFHQDCPAYQELINDGLPPRASMIDADSVVEEYDTLVIKKKAVEERIAELRVFFKDIVAANDGNKVDTPGWSANIYQRKMKEYNAADVLEILGPGALAAVAKVQVTKVNDFLKENEISGEDKARLLTKVRVNLAEPSLRVNLKKGKGK